MIDVKVKITQGLTVPQFAKQVTYAAAQSLTQVAKEGQKSVVSAIKSNFTVRTDWYEQARATGVRVSPAKKDDLNAWVFTNLDVLNDDEIGEDKVPSGLPSKRKSSAEARANSQTRWDGVELLEGRRWIAIPLGNARLNKRMLISASQRPKNLRNAVVKKTGRGLVVFQRQGRGKVKKLVAMYLLKPRARIKKRPTFLPPIQAVVEKRFGTIFGEQLTKALASAKQ